MHVSVRSSCTVRAQPRCVRSRRRSTAALIARCACTDRRSGRQCRYLVPRNGWSPCGWYEGVGQLEPHELRARWRFRFRPREPPRDARQTTNKQTNKQTFVCLFVRRESRVKAGRDEQRQTNKQTNKLFVCLYEQRIAREAATREGPDAARRDGGERRVYLIRFTSLHTKVKMTGYISHRTKMGERVMWHRWLHLAPVNMRARTRSRSSSRG
jgi:hypothetical protein